MHYTSYVRNSKSCRFRSNRHRLRRRWVRMMFIGLNLLTIDWSTLGDPAQDYWHILLIIAATGMPASGALRRMYTMMRMILSFRYCIGSSSYSSSIFVIIIIIIIIIIIDVILASLTHGGGSCSWSRIQVSDAMRKSMR